MNFVTPSLKDLPALLPAAVLAVILPCAARGQTTCRIYCPDGSSYIEECNSSTDRCPSSGGPGGGIVLPPPQVDARVEQHRRYRALINRGLLDDAAFAARPIGTDAEFASALARMHVDLSRTVVISKAYRDLHNARTQAERARYRDFYQPRFSAVDASDGLVPELKREHAAAKTAYEGVEYRLRRLRSIGERFIDANDTPHRAERQRIAAALTSKLRVAAHLGRLSRAEVAAGGTSLREEDIEKPVIILPAKAAPWYLVDTYLPHRSYERAIDDATSSLAMARMIALPSVGGSNEERLAYAEEMAGSAETSLSAMRAAERAYQEVMKQNDGARMHWAATRAQNAALWKETDSYSALAAEAESTLLWTQAVFERATSKAFKEGSVALAWKVFRKAHLDAELKILSAELFNGRQFERGDDEIMAAWKLGTPLVAPTLTGYSRVKMLDGIVKMARNLNGSAQEQMLSAADLLGQADAADARRHGDELFANLDVEARREARAALAQSDLPQGLKTFWESYFTRN